MVTFIDKMQENGADTEAEIVEKYMEAAEQEGVTLTRDEVLDVLAADFAGDMLDDADHPFSTILADAQPVYVGKDLPGEYKASEYTKTKCKRLPTWMRCFCWLKMASGERM